MLHTFWKVCHVRNVRHISRVHHLSKNKISNTWAIFSNTQICKQIFPLTPIFANQTFKHSDLKDLSNSHMGWRRPIGCLKLQAIFRKRATNYRVLLQKMTYKDKASYESSPPCITMSNLRMEWLRLVGSLKQQVSFAEYGLFYRALLQRSVKRPQRFGM